jgi:radical SAM protein with 4Fe4S-binding SPASM domain
MVVDDASHIAAVPGVVASRKFDGLGTIIVHRRSQEECLLPASAEFLWDALQLPTDLKTIVQRLETTYGLEPETARDDVIRFLMRLFDGGFVSVDGASVASPPSRRSVLRLLDGNRRVRAHVVQRHVPYFAQVVLTHRCQYRCRHCYLEEFHTVGLSLEAWTCALQELAGLGCLYIRFTGGEPLLYPHLFDLLEHARELGFAWSLNTNGHRVDLHTAERMSGLHPLEVSFSIYGAQVATHEAITGIPSSFRRCLRAVENLRACGTRVRLNFLLMRHNVGELEQVQRIADERGADLDINYLLFPTHAGDRRPLAFRLETSELIRLATTGRIPPPRRAFCAPGRCRLSVSADGTVFPCEMLPIALGTLAKHRLTDIWRGPVSAQFRASTFAEPAECSTCSIRDRCYSCPGLSYLEEGNPASRCRFLCAAAHAFARDHASAVQVGREV